MLMLEQDTFLPPEYRVLLHRVPIDQKRIYFRHYIDLERSFSQPYVRMLHAMLATAKEVATPSRKWWLAIGQLAFTCAEYDLLLELAREHPHTREFTPFVARIHVYRHEFEKALHACQLQLDSSSQRSQSTSWTEFLLLVETYFTLGLARLYLREFEKAEEVIRHLEELIMVIQQDDAMPTSLKPRLLLQFNSLKALKALFMGHVDAFRTIIDETLTWLDDVKDPYWKAFFLNLAGISRFQAQEMEEGMELLKQSLALFEQVRDHRGMSVVGGNLGTAMLLEGLRTEGREILEQVADASEKLGNHYNAVGQLLTIAKSYLDEKMTHKAMKYLQEAERLAGQIHLDDPIINAYFCYLHARIDELKKAEKYLDFLRDRVKKIPKKSSKRADLTTILWHRFAESVFSLALGNLSDAMTHIEEGLAVADKHGHYDLSLEFSHLSLEISLKRYLLNPTIERLHEALFLMEDMQLLVRHIETPFYTTIFQLMKGYVLLALFLPEEAVSSVESHVDMTKSVVNADQEREYNLFQKRVTELRKKDILGGSIWLTKEYLSTLFVTESLRLLSNLQFQQAAAGQPIQEKEKLPSTIMLLRNDGMSLFTYKFEESKEEAPDEQVISSFLIAISSFAQEMFGSGALKRIDQGNFMLLMEPISEELFVLVVASEETYSLRRKLRLFSQELKQLNLEVFKDSVFMFSEDDPIFKELKDIVRSIFSPSSSEEL